MEFDAVSDVLGVMVCLESVVALSSAVITHPKCLCETRERSSYGGLFENHFVAHVPSKFVSSVPIAPLPIEADPDVWPVGCRWFAAHLDLLAVWAGV